jgi:hypothetical protein
MDSLMVAIPAIVMEAVVKGCAPIGAVTSTARPNVLGEALLLFLEASIVRPVPMAILMGAINATAVVVVV